MKEKLAEKNWFQHCGSLMDTSTIQLKKGVHSGFGDTPEIKVFCILGMFSPYAYDLYQIWVMLLQ